MRIAVLFCLMFAGFGQAWANVSLSDYRLVFEPRERLKQLYVFNNTNEDQTYRLSWVEMTMDQAGQQSEIVAPQRPLNSAAKMLRLSPRQISIPPGGSQTVKILARRPANPEFGEYRSHLKLQQLRQAQGAEDLTQALTGHSDKVSVGMSVTAAIVIPVFMRQQPSTGTELSIEKLEMGTGDTGRVLAIDLGRSGHTSEYADIDVYAGTSEEPLAIARGVGIYFPNEMRHFSLPLSDWSGHEPLRVVLRRHKSEQVLVEQRLQPSP